MRFTVHSPFFAERSPPYSEHFDRVRGGEMLHKTGDRSRVEFLVETVPVFAPKPSKLLISEDNVRLDGRQKHQFRPIFMKTGVITQAPGSAYIELNTTKVICGVYGPKQSTSEYSNIAEIFVDFKFAPFSRRGEKVSYMATPEEQEIAVHLTRALENCIIRELYPKSVIEVNIVVLESDGSALSAAINAASLALADGGIACHDIIASCSSAKLGTVFLLDPTEDEEEARGGHTVVALLPNNGVTTLLLHSGSMKKQDCETMIDLCVSGCIEIGKLMSAHLVSTAKSQLENNAAS